MIGVQKYLAILLLSVSWAAAQNSTGTVSVQHVTAVTDGADLRVEVTLTSPVDVASVETAVNPDRILIDLPGTTCNACTQNVSVSAGGIRRVRTGQHSTRPMVARVVVDLDQAHPYTLKTEGNRVILTVGPAENAHFQTNGAPVAATSGNLIGVFRRKKETAPPVVDNNAAYVPPTPPPTPTGPSFEPSSANTSATPLPVPPPQVAPPVAQSHPASVPAQNPAPVSPAQTQIAAAKPAAPAVPAPPPAIAARPSENLASPKVEASTAAVAPKPASTGAIGTAVVSPKTSEPAAPVAAAAAPAPVASAAGTKPEVEVAPAPKPPVPAVPWLATGMVTVNRHPPEAIVLAPAVPAAPSLATGTIAANRLPPAAIVLAPVPTPASQTREIAKAEAPAPVAKAVTAPAPEPASPPTVAEAAPSPSTNESASPADAASEEAMVIPRSDDPSLRTVFKVKYVAEGVAYLEGGRGQGLSEGMKLEVEDSNRPARQGDSKHAEDPKVVAELEVTAVAESSAVTEIHTPKRPVKRRRPRLPLQR